jgi:hypothetical protein
LFNETAHPVLTFAHQRQETAEISFLPNRDRVLEMLVYAPTGQWEYATKIFDTMLSLLIDIRH